MTASVRPLRSRSAVACRGVAPSAIRRPISRVRCCDRVRHRAVQAGHRQQDRGRRKQAEEPRPESRLADGVGERVFHRTQRRHRDGARPRSRPLL